MSDISVASARQWNSNPFSHSFADALLANPLQKLYGKRFKNADFWETLAKAREAVRLFIPALSRLAFPSSSADCPRIHWLVVTYLSSKLQASLAGRLLKVILHLAIIPYAVLQGGQTAGAREAKREALALRKAAAVEEQQRRWVSFEHPPLQSLQPATCSEAVPWCLITQRTAQDTCHSAAAPRRHFLTGSPRRADDDDDALRTAALLLRLCAARCRRAGGGMRGGLPLASSRQQRRHPSFAAHSYI